MRIGEIVKQYRNKQSLSLRQFAEKCNLSHSYIDKLEKGIDPRNGKNVEPTIDSLVKIAKAMNMELYELLILSGYIPENVIVTTKEVDGHIYNIGINKNIYPNGLTEKEIIEKLNALQKLEKAGFKFEPEEK